MIKIINLAVIIPTLNRPRSLQISLKSIKNQTTKPKEVIVVDNNKLKINRSIIINFNKKYKTNYRYISFLSSQNAPSARNYASTKTNCKFLAFLDDDDYWKKNYLEEFNKINENKKSDLYITEYHVVNEFKKKLFDFNIKTNFYKNDLYLWNPGIISSNIIIRKKIFDQINKFDNSISGSADKDLLIKILDHKMKYYVIKKKLVFWTKHKTQWSQNYSLLLKNNLLFYKKYQNKFDIITRLKFIKKIIYLFTRKILQN
jgi:glycosyltransferase involved in cell wall biosynthesis